MKRGFTLLEFVVVVLVSVVVTLMLLPVLFSKPERAAPAMCAGNLKQIGLALLMYSGEHKGYFPLTPEGNSFEPLAIGEYLADGKAYGCPMAPETATTADHSNYWYVGSGLKDDVLDARSTPLAHDMSGNHPDDPWITVLFADGHVSVANRKKEEKPERKPFSFSDAPGSKEQKPQSGIRRGS